MSQFLDDPNFNPGAVRETPDSRTVTVSSLLNAGVMGASQVDWEKGYDVEEELGFRFPITNQESSLSCVGQSWRYYAQILEYVEAKKFTKLSARDVYSQIFFPQGGSSIIEGAKVLTKKGIAEADTMPEISPITEQLMRSRIDATTGSINRALRYQAKSYAIIPSFADVDRAMTEAAIAIQQNYGAVTGADGTNPGWREPKGIVRPPQTGESMWGHAIYACGFGMVNGKRAIKFKNSWTDAWGDKGYGWLTEDYFASNHTFSFYTLVDLSDDWLKPLQSMLNVIKEPGKSSLYIVGKDSKIYRIPDENTWMLLKNMGAVPQDFAEPTAEQFVLYPHGGDFPSKKLMDALAPIALDVFAS